MSDPTTQPASPTPTPTPPAAPRTIWQRFGRWAVIIGGILVVLVLVVLVAIAGVVWLIGPFTLPSCDSWRTTDSLRNTYRNNKIEVTRIFDFATLNSTLSEITCTARVERAGGRETVSYRIYWIYWGGWTAQVSIDATLPACDSAQTTNTLRSMFQERKIEVKDISEIKTVTSSATENTCTAQVTTPGEEATINVRIFLQDGSPRVLITSVQPKTKPK